MSRYVIVIIIVIVIVIVIAIIIYINKSEPPFVIYLTRCNLLASNSCPSAAYTYVYALWLWLCPFL